jgi:hypothetical protein
MFLSERVVLRTAGQFHNMVIRVGQKHLHGSIRAKLGIVQKRNAKRLEFLSRCPSIFDLKRKMMITTGSDKNFDRISSRPAFIMLFDQMNKSTSGLEPRSVETERWSWHFLHPQQSHVELPTGFDISNHERDVVDLFNLNWSSGHSYASGQILWSEDDG